MLILIFDASEYRRLSQKLHKLLYFCNNEKRNWGFRING